MISDKYNKDRDRLRGRITLSPFNFNGRETRKNRTIMGYCVKVDGIFESKQRSICRIFKHKVGFYALIFI